MITVPKTHIILGITELNKEKFIPVKNRSFIKPTGGLWASPYTPNNEYVSAWHEWCSHESFGSGMSDDSIVIKLKDKAEIFVIDSQRDLIDFINIVGEEDVPYSIWKTPNFEKAREKFDGIFLTDKGQWETRLPLQNHQYSLYGWDCESLLIMNFDCIESWEYKRLDIIAEKQESAS